MNLARTNYARLHSTSSGKRVLDPQEPFLQRWNKIFVLVCVISVSLDPLFFYTPVIDGKRRCLKIDKHLAIAACILRSFTDVLYILRIILKFHTGFFVPSTRVLLFARGELITEHYAIAKRYLSTYFLVDILAILPLPQVLILNMDGLVALTTKDMLKFVVLCQYIPRVFRIYPLFNEATSSSGLFAKTAWAGAALNLFLYMLASHIVGAFWYLISVERKDKCWRDACKGGDDCNINYLYCGTVDGEHNSMLSSSCPLLEPEDIKKPTDFDFGIFLYALKSNVVEMEYFPRKFLYCFWWGLRSLSSLGQNLNTSTFVGEIIFAIAISIIGLVLFSLLIGNMQKYLQSIAISTKEEEMREKRREAESWMSQRMLPESLRERINRYKEYKWQKTRGVDEELFIRDLPKDVRRDINRHLRLRFLNRVPMFSILDETLLDALCDQLKPVLYTEQSYLFREGDPVDEMLFVTRGKILTMTTNGGTPGFFNSVHLEAGDFCGEELFTWALDPRSSSNLPLSTRTVKAVSAVEAFALMAEDLKSFASKFRLFHSTQVRHVFRYHSQQWRTWATCFIQAAWRRQRKRRLEKSLYENEERLQNASARESGTTPSFGAAIYVSRFAANALQPLRRNRVPSANLPHDVPPPLIPKPTEPDFDAELNNIEIVVAK